MSKTHIVWFKRDLRIHDHAPLAAACASGAPVLALYIFEPEFWTGPDGTAHQLSFLKQSLTQLEQALDERGAQLVIRIGAAADVFASLHRDLGITAIHTYREGKSRPEAARNDAVRRWALRAGVSLREQEAADTLRHLGPPSEWHARWNSFIQAPRKLAPEFIFSAFARSDEISSIALQNTQVDDDAAAPPGGRSHGVRLLRRAFVAGDAHTFRDVMRALKQHIGMGTLSIREAVQAAMRAARVGAPGQSISYAEALIERLRDECERQYRIDERSATRPLGDIPSAHSPAGVRASRVSQSIRGEAAPKIQLSFDFPGSTEEPRRA